MSDVGKPSHVSRRVAIGLFELPVEIAEVCIADLCCYVCDCIG